MDSARGSYPVAVETASPFQLWSEHEGCNGAANHVHGHRGPTDVRYWGVGGGAAKHVDFANVSSTETRDQQVANYYRLTEVATVEISASNTRL